MFIKIRSVIALGSFAALASCSLETSQAPEPIGDANQDQSSRTPRSIANNLEAESNDGMAGVQFESCSEGGQDAGWIDSGDYIQWKISVPSSGSYSVTTRSASMAAASYAILVDGTQVATNAIGNTGAWQNWQSFTTSAFAMNSGTHTLRIQFTSNAQNLDYLELDAASAPPTDPPTTPPTDPTVTWRKANLTWFTSYPDPGSEECIAYNGCTWAGYFACCDEQKPLSWVQSHNIAAVHSKDWSTYDGKTLRLRKDGKTIDVVVYDECADSDCSGCCTRNANQNGYGFLIDIESYTAQRFGTSADGTVEWYCVDCQ